MVLTSRPAARRKTGRPLKLEGHHDPSISVLRRARAVYIGGSKCHSAGPADPARRIEPARRGGRLCRAEVRLPPHQVHRFGGEARLRPPVQRAEARQGFGAPAHRGHAQVQGGAVTGSAGWRGPSSQPNPFARYAAGGLFEPMAKAVVAQRKGLMEFLRLSSMADGELKVRLDAGRAS